MSADNTHVVSKLDGTIDRYGIFEVPDLVGYPAKWFNSDNAIQVYNYAVPAILAAHILENSNPTEYGVVVDTAVLADVPVGHDGRPLGWGYVK